MHERIEYTTRSCPLGRVLVAATPRGVCFVDLAANDAALRRSLAREFPFAEFAPGRSPELQRWTRQLLDYLSGRTTRVEIALDVRGSRFQKRVWAALRRIPRGETRAYSEVARAVGAPQAARAVANACAANPVPILTPCHRVIERSGRLGGYARGVARKRALLQLERTP